MQSLWSITIDDYLEVVRRAKEANIQPGESMEAIFVQYMNEKGQRPCANTELTKDELIQKYIEKDKKICDITTDSQGKQSVRVITPKEKP